MRWVYESLLFTELKTNDCLDTRRLLTRQLDVLGYSALSAKRKFVGLRKVRVGVPWVMAMLVVDVSVRSME